MTVSDGTPQPATDKPEPVRLRVEEYRALATARGYTTVTALARLHGIGRDRLHDLMNGQTPNLPTAMRMAADLGTQVEVIWERITHA